MHPQVSMKWWRSAACLAAFLLAAGCSAPDSGQAPADSDRAAPSSAPVARTTRAPSIVDYGPRDVTAGKVFNAQPDGQAAIWIRMDASLEGTDAVIRLGNTELKSSISDHLITALVPPEAYAKPGTLSLFVVQHVNGKELASGPVDFVVR